VTQFINALRSLAGICDFGMSLEERLRDQLVIGIKNDAWQKEVFRLHSTNASTLVQVEATALVLEQASVQQQRLHSLSKISGSSSDMTIRRVAKPLITSTSNRKSSSTTSAQKVRQLIPGKNCCNCGNNAHSAGEKCPADTVVCSACHKINHFERVCKAEIVTSSSPSSGQRKRLHKVTLNNGLSDNASDFDGGDLNVIATIKSGKFAVSNASLNGDKLSMLCDPGAAFSVISKRV